MNILFKTDTAWGYFKACTIEKQVTAYFLAPPVVDNNDRQVKGDKAVYLGCNITGEFANVSTDVELTVRISFIEVSQATESLIAPGGTGKSILDRAVTSPVNKILSEQLYRKQDLEAPLVASWFNTDEMLPQQRVHSAFDTAHVNVLKTQYIKLGYRTGNGYQPMSKGFHQYIPMNRKNLDKDRTNIFEELGGSASVGKVTRYVYYKPVVMLVEIIPECGSPQDNVGVGNLIRGNLYLKHSFRDSL